MTTEDFITDLFCRVDDRMENVPNHPQAALWPSELVTIGMLAGYCGTLMTPMGANYNIVPAALLELKDKYLVIKTQIPTALVLL